MGIDLHKLPIPIKVGVPLKHIGRIVMRWLSRLAGEPIPSGSVPRPVPNLVPGSSALVEVRFKESYDNWEKIEALDFRVQWVFMLMRCYVAACGGDHIRVTDIDTPGVHQADGVHYCKRALDVGIEPLTLVQWEKFGDWVNEFLDYGRDYKTILVGRHDENGNHNDHSHVQTPPPYMSVGIVPLYAAK